MPKWLRYLEEARYLAERAALVTARDRLTTCPTGAELRVFRNVFEQIEHRQDHEAIASWIALAEEVDDRQWIRRLLELMVYFMDKGMLPASSHMAALAREVLSEPEYSEDRIPPRFRHLCPWLERIGQVGEDDPAVAQLAESLTTGELESLGRLCEKMKWSGELDALEAWVFSEGHVAERHRMMLFLEMCDLAGVLR